MIGLKGPAVSFEAAKAYRKEARANHPDKGKNDADRAARTERMKNINAAYDRIKTAMGW